MRTLVTNFDFSKNERPVRFEPEAVEIFRLDRFRK